MSRARRFGVQQLASSKASGVALILSGLAMAAYGLPSGAGSSAPQSALRADIGTAALVDQRTKADEAATGRQAGLRAIMPPPTRATEPARTLPAPVVVTIPPRPSEPALILPRAAAIPKDRDALAHELQKELKRVGCYTGEINGTWTPSARHAMKAFTDRLNATLPVEEPDAVLLVMVRSQPDTVCGESCPAGQGLSKHGRCVPNAILARAIKKAAPPPIAVAHMPARSPAPAADPAPAARRAPAVARRSRTIAAAALAPAPPVVPAAPVIAAGSIEGRMALAGPTAEPTPAAGVHPLATATPLVRSRAATRARRPQASRRFVSAPRPGTFARTVFRRLDSSL
jgi:hypothetical protein